MNSVLIFRCPTWQHEGLAEVVRDAMRDLSSIRVGGAPDLKLFNGLGVKTPDIVLCDDNSQSHAGFPTVVFEVGVSQTQASLNFNAARLLFGSKGQINAVVNLKVTTKGTAEAPGELESLFVDVWRLLVTVVDDKDVEGLTRRKILTKENQSASPTVVSWSFTYITRAQRLFRLEAKPHCYQVGHPAAISSSSILINSRSIPTLSKVATVRLGVQD